MDETLQPKSLWQPQLLLLQTVSAVLAGLDLMYGVLWWVQRAIAMEVAPASPPILDAYHRRQQSIITTSTMDLVAVMSACLLSVGTMWIESGAAFLLGPLRMYRLYSPLLAVTRAASRIRGHGWIRQHRLGNHPLQTWEPR